MNGHAPGTGDGPGYDPGQGKHGFWASQSVASAIYIAALVGMVVSFMVAVATPARDVLPALPALAWLATSAGLFGLWLRWPRWREVAELRRRARAARPGSRFRSDGTDWARLPVLLAPFAFAFLAAATVPIVTIFLWMVVLAVPRLPGSVGGLTVGIGAGLGVAFWIGVFAVWLWWPERRRLADRQRRRRREARRRLAVIKRNGWGWWPTF